MRDISARELKGHNILAVERFRDNTRWMIEFSVLRPCTYGSPGDEMRVSHRGRLSGRLTHQQRREIKIKKCAHVIEGRVLYERKSGGNEMFKKKKQSVMPFAQRICTCSLIKRNGNGRSPDWTWSLWRRASATAEKASSPTRLPAAMSAPWTITGRSCFPIGDAAFTKKQSKVIPPQVDAACIRELWFLEDGRFVEVSGVTTKYRSAYERFSTCYRTVHHIVKGRDWQDYPPEEIADAFEDINDHPFDGMPGVFYEV